LINAALYAFHKRFNLDCMDTKKLVGFIGVLTVSTFLCCSDKPKADVSDYKIAYNVYYDTANDDYEIFVMNADGTGQKNISNAPGVEWVYYAYKDKLYFVSDRDTTHRMYFLYEMDADGNNVRKVTDLRLEDSWMSSRNDGQELVVAGRIGKEIRYQLFLIDVKTGKYAQLTTDTAASFADPHFSPDGNHIVFRHRKNRRNYQDEKAEIWMMDADGSNLKQLTHFPNDTTAQWHSYHAGPPCWEPNRNLISYISRQKGKHNIFTMKPDGTNVTQLSTDTLSEGWHAWSPDGEWLAFDVSNKEGYKFNIYLRKRDGSDQKKLTSDWRSEMAPVFVLPAKE
jgi:TolB protein